MSVFARFVAFEAIGWLVAAFVLSLGVRYEIVSVRAAWLLFGLFVAKDLVLFPLTKRAYELGPTHGSAELIGSEVRVAETLDPQGYVVAGTERWRARLLDAGAGPLEQGDRARVCALEGIALVVERISDGDPGPIDEP